MERKTYLDYLRVLATVAVVFLHVAAQNQDKVDVGGNAWEIFNIINGLSRWCVPGFLMISGALFLNRNIPLKVIWQKYILRLFIAFVFWTAVYVLLSNTTLKEGIWAGINDGGVLRGHYHMWYILMIIGLYSFMPFYKMIVSNRNFCKYYLIIFGIIVIAIPYCLMIIPFIVDSTIIEKLLSGAKDNLDTIKGGMMLGSFSFYFVLGHYLESITIKRKARVIIYLGGLLGSCLTVYFSRLQSLSEGSNNQSQYNWFSLAVFAETVAIWTFFKYRKYSAEGANKLITMISKRCFGVYLCHAFVLEKMELLGINTLSFAMPAISVPIIAATVFAISLLVSIGLSYIPIIKKYCV